MADNLCGFIRLGDRDMVDRAAPELSGELIVRNGRQAGTAIPLAIPVTVIGSADQCDVRLNGPGMVDVHCLITITPAGPAIRSWHPAETRVNGSPTTAAVLADGDELRVGPCTFQVAWYVEDLVPLTPAEAEPDPVALTPADEHEYPEVVPISDDEWRLEQRATELHEQELRLAAHLDARQQKLADLHRQLADGREILRRERAEQTVAIAAERKRVKQMKAAVRPLHKAARTDRVRGRKLYRQFAERMARETATHKRLADAARVELDRQRQGLRESAARQEADAAATRRRLTEAAELLAANQRRVLADRRQAEAFVAQLEQAAGDRVRVAEAQQQAFEAGRDRLEARAADLMDEIRRLEARATQTRAGLQELEQQRARLTAGMAETRSDRPITHVVQLADVVPLDPKADRTPDQFLRDLHLRERELHRDQLAMTATHTELQNRLADLADDRAVLAEQVAGLAVAQEQWQSTEVRTVAELEIAAQAVHAWERSLALREREAADLDQRRRQQADDLWQLRVRLEGWQSALMTAEETATAARERAEAELVVRSSQLDRWEAGLDQLCRKWVDARYRDRDELLSELGRWSTERGQFLVDRADLDRVRAETFAEATRVAAEAAACEQARAELTASPGQPGIQAERRLRVLVRTWEQRFDRFLTEMTTRTSQYQAEAAVAEQRSADLQSALVALADKRAEIVEREQDADVRQYVRERVIEERGTAIAVDQWRRDRTDRELTAVRDQAEQLAARVIGTGPLSVRVVDPLPTILPLSPTRRN